MNEYTIIDHKGFLAVAHNAIGWDKPEIETVAWVSKVKTSQHPQLVGTLAGRNGHDDGETQSWPVQFGIGGAFSTTHLRTARLNSIIATVPIKSPRKRASGKPWEWREGAWH